MIMKYINHVRFLLAASVMVIAVAARADTISTRTETIQVPYPGSHIVDFTDFDVNHNGVLTLAETGEGLFYLFDNDGNEVIDNIEFDTERVYTLPLVEKHTTVSFDFDDDGLPDMVQHDVNTYITASGLDRFNYGPNGKMSPREFVNRSFLSLDKDDSKVIELDEWRTAYTESLRPVTAEQERYND
jgi:hypothetical protein